jgi:hypothetical protein
VLVVGNADANDASVDLDAIAALNANRRASWVRGRLVIANTTSVPRSSAATIEPSAMSFLAA